MCRTEESNSGSYAGRIAPPGMPKMTSTPRASSERTSAPEALGVEAIFRSDVPDRGVEQRVVRGQDRAARDAEDDLSAERLQRADERAGGARRRGHLQI